MKPLFRQLWIAVIAFCGIWSSSAQAWEQGDWLVRLRGIVIDPDTSSDEVVAPALGGAIPGSGVRVDTDFVPELDFTYMLDEHWGLELILATSKHTVIVDGSARDLGKVLDSWVLPPTLTLQYHFFPEKSVQPYLGVGANYTIFYSEKLTSGYRSDNNQVNLTDSFGWALQAGVDFKLKNDWFINFDVKYVDIKTDATIRYSTAGDVFVNDVNVDPWIFGFGIGKRF